MRALGLFRFRSVGVFYLLLLLPMGGAGIFLLGEFSQYRLSLSHFHEMKLRSMLLEERESPLGNALAAFSRPLNQPPLLPHRIGTGELQTLKSLFPRPPIPSIVSKQRFELEKKAHWPWKITSESTGSFFHERFCSLEKPLLIDMEDLPLAFEVLRNETQPLTFTSHFVFLPEPSSGKIQIEWTLCQRGSYEK